MKTCKNCGANCEDNAIFCTECGKPLDEVNAQDTATPQQPVYVVPDPYDHTKEFDAKDISDNKIFAIIAYIMGSMGIIIALLASQESPYSRFHVRQSLKITIAEILATIISLILFFTILVPIAGCVCIVILFVVRVICFFSVCCGNAKEAPIVRSFKFFK